MTTRPQTAVVDTSRSPFARMRPTGIADVRLNDPFWAPRLETNRTVTIPAQLEQCEETGRIDNFRRASGRKACEFQGIFFNDSDVYKWIEAAAFSLAYHPDPALEASLNAVVDEVVAAQCPDGYLNTYFMFERASERWTNLRDMHELYCAGHLLQAAVAHHRATGNPHLLDAAARFANHIGSTFSPTARPGACGHEEIEMGLVELFRDTGDRRHLDQAAFFIGQRGQKPPVIGGSAYHQDHMPFAHLSEMVGHAVRMVYLNAGAADVVLETGNEPFRSALDRLWNNMAGRRMYITGGLGARYEGEAFGRDFELPNDRAYAESCAAIGSMYWNWRMTLLTGEAKYADVFETALYNGMLAGLSLDGTSYFYQNPLSDDGHHRRQPWFGCACCPPNLARMLASLPGYCCSVSTEGAWVHQYIAGSARLTLPGGVLQIRLDSRYPWEGAIQIEVTDSPGLAASLFLRIPGWCRSATASVNGQSVAVPGAGQYLRIDREWKAGDRVDLSLSMPVERIHAHPWLSGANGQVALTRGPLVYCLEGADHTEDVRDLALGSETNLKDRFDPALLGGVVVLEGVGAALDSSSWSGAFYRPESETPRRTANLRAIPYYAWANREAGPMKVWIPSY